MNLELSFTERALLTMIFPKEDSYENLVCRREVMKEIRLTSEEIKDNEFKSLPEGATWNDKKKSIGITLTDIQKKYIGDKLKFTSESGKLNSALMDLYEKILN